MGRGKNLRVAKRGVRRLSKDYERLPETGEAMIYGAMSRIMLRRLAKGAA
jgi:transposase